MTLTDFLLARIAEDEAEGPRHPDWCRSVADDQACDCDGLTRVLAECEAKRRIVAKAQRANVAMDTGINPASAAASFALTEVLGYLALPYADHPDYREEWKP